MTSIVIPFAKTSLKGDTTIFVTAMTSGAEAELEKKKRISKLNSSSHAEFFQEVILHDRVKSAQNKFI